MNIRYFGPFDGNNVTEVVRILRQLKDMSGPKLLHLHTVKGKGYKPAEAEATIWHALRKVLSGDRRAHQERRYGAATEVPGMSSATHCSNSPKPIRP